MRRCRAEASGESVSQEVSDDVSDPVSGGVKQIQWRIRVSSRLRRTSHINLFTKNSTVQITVLSRCYLLLSTMGVTSYLTSS